MFDLVFLICNSFSPKLHLLPNERS